MELILNRVNYMQANIVNQQCMKLTPLGNKELSNKVALADNSGLFQIFSLKNSGIAVHFKLELPSPPAVVELGGKAKDKIFVATSAGTVLGFTKKGKQIFELNADLAEPVKTMYIEGSNIFISGDFTLRHFKESEDSDKFFVSQEKISDIICLPYEKLSELVPILACCDRTIKVLKDSSVQAQLHISGIPTCLCLYGNDGGSTGDKVLYGTTDGKLGLAKLNRFLQEVVWELNPPANKNGITCITNFDVTCNGYLDIIVGRDDGWLEIYELDELEQPVIRYSICLNESITCLQGGNVGSSDYIEIVCSTYSGWVIGLTTEPIRERKPKSISLTDPETCSSGFVDRSQEDQKFIQLRKDIEDLEKKVVEERERYRNEVKKPGQMSVVPAISINERFTFNPKEADYLLTIETQTPIEYILLQCDVPVDIKDVERNHAIVSFTPCTPEEGNGLLVTFRCQANATRMDVKIQPIEGQHGIMRAYVTPRLQPKVCQVRQFIIKPLSLHYRIHQLDESRPFNRLRLVGNFEATDSHAWLSKCLPELPEKVPPGDAGDYCFTSAYLGTMLQCSYQRGELGIRSENISTISILKDVLTRQATNQGIKLDISFELEDSSVVHVLQSVSPMISRLIVLSKKVQLLDGLKELRTQENNDDFLSGEFKDMLDHAEDLIAEHKQQSQLLKRLYGIITDLYIDWHKFKGQSVKDRLPKLTNVMKKHNLEELLKFFQESI